MDSPKSATVKYSSFTTILSIFANYKSDLIWNLISINWTTSRFEPRLVFKHTQKPQILISDAR